jgi:twitching motility protein PilT
MNALDGLLKMLASHQADELRLGVERNPVLLSRGVPKNFTLAETGERVLRQMLGSLLSPEVERGLARGNAVETTYRAGDLGVYQVQFLPRGAAEPGFDVILSNPPPREPEPAAAAQPIEAPLEPSSPSLRARPITALAATPHSHAARPTPVLETTPHSHAARPTAALEALLAQAVALRASDVHVRDGEPAYARVDGRLVPLNGGPQLTAELLGDELALRAPSRDLSLASPSAGRVRLHAFRTGGATAIAVRVLPPVVPRLSSLGFPLDLSDLALLPSGLVLLTGPTGSGKSTTAAALCQEALRQRSALLLTLEDPVEFTFDTRSTESVVRQRQIGADVVDFATGLRDALREDPDLLLVGEMRDAESISLALTAAETGHLVFASLHSRSAASAIERIVDTYPAARQQQLRIQLADSLRAIVAQRLLPRAQGSGRVVALEVLRKNAAVANLIREGKLPQLVNVMQSSRKEGMLQLERSLAELCRSGAVDERTARAAANDQEALSEYLRGAK